jgi:hypothetical protein
MRAWGFYEALQQWQMWLACGGFFILLRLAEAAGDQ